MKPLRCCYLFFMITVLSLGLTSCHKKDKIKTPPLTTVQKKQIQQVQVTISRYEQALFDLDLQHLAQGIENLYGKFPENLIAKDSWKNPDMINALKDYLTDPVIKAIYTETTRQYPDMKDLELALDEAFKHYLTHFPDSPIPHIYTLISGLDFSMPSVFGYQNNLFINLDMYLGGDYKYYAYAGMPKFIATHCEKKYIATDCFLKGIVYRHLPDKTLLTVLDNMIYEGKKIYFTHIMFPDAKEQHLLGYADDKYQWAIDHEAQVWQYFVEKDILYSKDEDKIRKMVDETPFIPEFGNTSAGRIGVFLGYHIVQNYLHNHPDMSLAKLMENTDSQHILNEAYYKPVLR